MLFKKDQHQQFHSLICAHLNQNLKNTNPKTQALPKKIRNTKNLM